MKMKPWLQSYVAFSASPRLCGFHGITVARSTIVIVIVLNAIAALAQEPKESVPPINPTPAEDVDRVIYDLEVSPADEPHPAMKYRLLPNPADLKPGNAATQYYKAFVLDATPPTEKKFDEYSREILWGAAS